MAIQKRFVGYSTGVRVPTDTAIIVLAKTGLNSHTASITRDRFVSIVEILTTNHTLNSQVQIR